MAADYSISQVPEDLWEVIDTVTGKSVIMEGEPLSPHAEGKSRDAVDFLKPGEIRPVASSVNLRPADL